MGLAVLGEPRIVELTELMHYTRKSLPHSLPQRLLAVTDDRRNRNG